MRTVRFMTSTVADVANDAGYYLDSLQWMYVISMVGLAYNEIQGTGQMSSLKPGARYIRVCLLYTSRCV